MFVVVILIFSKASGAFQTMIAAALILIYIKVLESAKILIRSQLTFNQIAEERFIKLAALLNDQSINEHMDASKALSERIASGNLPFLIDASFSVLIELIALGEILSALF
jgi:hypothetical protein